MRKRILATASRVAASEKRARPKHRPLPILQIVSAPHPSAATRRRYRRRSLNNLSMMGHCAPTVMQTILDLGQTEKEWAVRLVAGLPGGIGNTGNECGGITAPLVVLGLRYALRAGADGLPLIIERGHDLCNRFLKCHGTMMCRDIRSDRLPLRCVKVMRHSPELYAEVIGNGAAAVCGMKRDAYRELYAHFTSERFHCAHAVLHELSDTIHVRQELLDGTAAFMGGTLLRGLTCSALTAGVMALGLRVGCIERSRGRVLRMIALMVAGRDAFADDVNEFNRIMNAGNRISEWFIGEFGSTQCGALTNCDFASAAGVRRYINTSCATRCKIIACRVAEEVRRVAEDWSSATTHHGTRALPSATR